MTVGIGSNVEAISQNFSSGPIEQTGSALDLSITGDGFFATKGAGSGKALFTRNGSFTLDDQGRIQDGSDNVLQIFAPGADPATDTPVDAQVALTNGGADFAGLTVADDGTMVATYADGSNQTIGRVALAGFVAAPGLRQTGSSNWEATGLSGAPAYGLPNTGSFGGLLSGALERSNVDIAEELVSLITAQRYFQANAKAIDIAMQISQAVINLRT